jgi:hypothetical protein
MKSLANLATGRGQDTESGRHILAARFPQPRLSTAEIGSGEFLSGIAVGGAAVSVSG